MSAQAPAARRDFALAYALLFVTPALWSVNYLVARWAPGRDRAACAGARALDRRRAGARRVLRRRAARQARAIRAEWKQLLVLGALGMWVCGAFVYIGGRSTSAVNIGLLYAASPVLIALASALWLHERLGPRQVLGVALALAGVLHILLRGDWPALLRAAASTRATSGSPVAVLCWTAYSLLLRAWPSAFGPLARLTLIAVAGIVVLVPFTVWEAIGLAAYRAVVALVGAGPRRRAAAGRRRLRAPTRSCSASSARRAWAW